MEALVLWEAGDRNWEVVAGPGANLDIVGLESFQALLCRVNLPGEGIPQTIHPRDSDVATGCQLCRMEGFEEGNQLQDPTDPEGPLRRLRRLRVCGLLLCVEHYNEVIGMGHCGVRTCPFCRVLIDHYYGPYIQID